MFYKISPYLSTEIHTLYMLLLFYRDSGRNLNFFCTGAVNSTQELNVYFKIQQKKSIAGLVIHLLRISVYSQTVRVLEPFRKNSIIVLGAITLDGLQRDDASKYSNMEFVLQDLHQRQRDCDAILSSLIQSKSVNDIQGTSDTWPVKSIVVTDIETNHVFKYFTYANM